MFQRLQAAPFPFLSRHPGLVFASLFIPLFLLANAILAASGQPKNPQDIALVIRNIFVGCGLLELACLFVRRLKR